MRKNSKNSLLSKNSFDEEKSKIQSQTQNGKFVLKKLASNICSSTKINYDKENIDFSEKNTNVSNLNNEYQYFSDNNKEIFSKNGKIDQICNNDKLDQLDQLNNYESNENFESQNSQNTKIISESNPENFANILHRRCNIYTSSSKTQNNSRNISQSEKNPKNPKNSLNVSTNKKEYTQNYENNIYEKNFKSE